MTDITPARREALIDALLFGGIWAIHKADRRPSGDRHHSPVTINRLRAAGLVEWHYTTGQYYSGEYRLTERGKAVARSLDDTESSASRQHFIDTGAYLTYGAREELNPPAFAIGDLVKSNLFESEHEIRGYKILSRNFVPDTECWFYEVEVVGGPNNGQRFSGCVINPSKYKVVTEEQVEEAEEIAWEMLIPQAAQAAALVAMGRGDELVVLPQGTPLSSAQHDDGVTAVVALDLLAELVEAGR